MDDELLQLAASGSSLKVFPRPVALEPAPEVSFYDRVRANTLYCKVYSCPADDLTQTSAAQFISHLKSLSEPLSFEIFNLKGRIQLQVVLSKSDESLLRNAFNSSFEYSYPEALIDDPLFALYENAKQRKAQDDPKLEYHFRDYVAPPPFFLPVTGTTDHHRDALELLYSIVAEIPAEELAVYQVLLMPCHLNWHRAGRELIARGPGINISQGAHQEEYPEFKSLIPEHEQKFVAARAAVKLDPSHPFFAVAVRCAVIASSRQRAEVLIGRLDAGVMHIAGEGRKLRHVDRRDYFAAGLSTDAHRYMLLNRVAFRPGFLLNSKEVASFCHLPFSSVFAKEYRMEVVNRSYPVPEYLTKNGELIGESLHRGVRQPVYINERLQNRHCYMLGKSGCGKSTLIQQLVLEHLRKGDGFGVIDPHGTLITEQILPFIPKSRIDDVVLLDAGDFEYPLAFNLLAHSGTKQEKEHIRTDLLSFFEELLGDRLGVNIEHLLNFSLATLLTRQDVTLADIERLLTDSSFRDKVLRDIPDDRIIRFWETEFPRLFKTSVTTITNKLSPLLLPDSTIQPMLTSKDNQLDFLTFMNERKIFLCNLSHGRIGKRTAQLLGRLIVSRIQISAMMREDAALGPDWYLYVDEFQHLTTPSMKDILSGARKYKVHLPLANQIMGDIPQDILKNVFNASTLLFFNSDLPQEQRIVSQVLGSKFTTDEIGQLAIGEAFAKIESHVFNLKTAPPPRRPAVSCVKEIIQQSRDRYSIKTESTTQQSGGLGGKEQEKDQQTEAPPSHNKTHEPNRVIPVLTQPRVFESNLDKVVHYLRQADYLSTPQILELCYGHIAKLNSRKSTASQDLKKLIERKSIKEEENRKPKIYFVGSRPKPTPHNLAVRDLFVALILSNLKIFKTDFAFETAGLVPDLTVDFGGADDATLRTYWEIDMDTENISELISKARRYETLEEKRVFMVLFSEQRLLQSQKALLKYPFCSCHLFSEIASLSRAHNLISLFNYPSSP